MAQRLLGWRIDRVVSSDLGRAEETAAAMGREFETDPAWRELDLGAWEGLTREEVEERFPDQVRALAEAEDVSVGGGETIGAFRRRVVEAFAGLIESAEDEDHVLVVAHGGVITTVASWVLGIEGTPRRSLGRITNTSLTTVLTDPEGHQLVRFNDAGHLGALPGWAAARLAAGDTVISLIRHSRTEANLAGRWQGTADGILDELGTSQAAGLAGWYGELDVLYASRLRRALDTAGALAVGGIAISEHPDLHEMSMGEWEDRTADDIRAGWSELWRRIYQEGEDLPRGSSGEAFSQVADRMRKALAELAARHEGARIGVVSHGGAIRVYLGDLLGLDHRSRLRLAIPFNTAVSHVVVGRESVRLADFNVAPHLA